MWREVVTYNSSILDLNVEIKNHVVFHLFVFMYEPKSNSFVVTSQKKQAIQLLETYNGGISFLGFKVLLDHRCGIFLPYLVVQDNKHCYFYCLDPNNYEWIVRDQFVVPDVFTKNIQLCDSSWCIENGPTLIWTVRDEVFIYKSEYSLNFNRTVPDRILRVPLACKKGLDVVSRILWWHSGACPYDQGMIVFKDNRARTVNAYFITLDNEKRKVDVVLNKPIVPFLYLAITSCAIVIPKHLPSVKAPNEISYRMFISTTQSQMLEFYHGKYIKHINIPLSCCQNIQMFESPESDLILLCSQEDLICVVNWTTSKILKTYQIVPKLLIDDFIGSGTFQVLLFQDFKYDGHHFFDNFILTDFCKVDVVKSKENKKGNGLSHSELTDIKSQSEESSIGNVVIALMRKVQATDMSIIQCKMEKSEKSSFVKAHCESLCNMLVDEMASPLLQTPGLAQLVTGQGSCHTDLHVQNSKIIVRSKWQEITNSKWIIGVDIENVGPRTVSNIALCTVNKTSGTITSSSKIKHSQVHSRNREILPSGQRATIIVITSLPNFSFESFLTVGLMLTWKHYEEEKYISQFCGDITLGMADVVNSERRKCQHLALCSLKTQVLVSIGNCNMSDVVELLRSNMDTCEFSSLLQKHHLRSSPLSSAHVSWTCTKAALSMKFCTRDYNQLCMCLHILGKQLPGSFTWHLVGSKQALELVITSIKKEISVRISELNILLKTRTNFKPVGIERSMTVNDVEEMSVKRRRISQYKDKNGSQAVHVTMYQKNFTTICPYLNNTENVFLTFLFLQNKLE